MASGGSGSGFNPFKKKGLLTPKLPKKDANNKDQNKEKSPETSDEVPEASTSFAEQDCPQSHGPVQAVAESPITPVVAMFPCERPRCSAHCHLNSVPIGAGRLSLSSSSENLVPSESKAVAKRKSKTLTLRRQKKDSSKNGSKQGKFWAFRIKKRVPSGGKKNDPKLPEPSPPPDAPSCVCTGYKRTEDSPMQNLLFSTPGPSMMGASASPIQPNSTRSTRLALGAGPGPTGVRRLNPQLFQLVPAPPQQVGGVLDITRANNDDYPTEDIDEIMIQQRARDMELGIEISPSHFAYPHLHYSSSVSSSSSGSSGSSTVSDHAAGSLNIAFQSQCVVTTTTLYPGATSDAMLNPRESFHESEYGEFGTLSAPLSAAPSGRIPRTVHTQVDYIHCLVPDLVEITKCSFYWGVIDRYEAERLLEHRPEGTFLLRDSAQEEFLFSVSFRRYGRSLHARIEQWNHKFSFDSHDPGVFASDTVCGLMEHYKDPSCCMFFEPMLTIPLNRTFPFSLQHLCRTVICNSTTYDGVNFLPLPKSLRDYLKYYHYKQKVRVRRFEVHN